MAAEIKEKKHFARLYREQKDAYLIAGLVLPAGTDPARVVEVAMTWPLDKVVLKEITRLDKKPVPKYVLVCKLMTIAKENNKDRVAALAKVAELEGYTAAAAVAKGSKKNDKMAELRQMLEEDDRKAHPEDYPNG